MCQEGHHDAVGRRGAEQAVFLKISATASSDPACMGILGCAECLPHAKPTGMRPLTVVTPSLLPVKEQPAWCGLYGSLRCTAVEVHGTRVIAYLQQVLVEDTVAIKGYGNLGFLLLEVTVP